MKYSLILVALLAATSARAGGVDMSTQTCQDWLDADDDVQDLMAAWLRGFIAGRSTSTMYDAGRERADKQSMKAYCQSHPQNGVISAASLWGK
jgi:hypothetical protein